MEEIIMMKTNWEKIEEEIAIESESEDCMIPIRDRLYPKTHKGA